jgi:hypothetical protein
MIKWVRKLALLFLLMIYLSVSLNFALIYTAHLLHHVITSTLHHHHDHDHYEMHSHFTDDHHHHSHSYAIDHAIREVKHEKDHDETEAPPLSRLEIKFSVHHLPGITASDCNYPYYMDIENPFIVNYKSPTFIPLTPPPEYSL